MTAAKNLSGAKRLLKTGGRSAILNLAKKSGRIGGCRQLGAEKTSDTKWKLDFSNAKCPALESKYAE